tara:strand:+ start:679 stop:903 length:225 start_codon:yes stop_codon:yes gene_type:complete
MSLIRHYAKRIKNAPALSRESIRAEANLGRHFISLMSAWSSLAKDSRNKNDWNHFAKYVLKEVEEIDQIIKEEK